MNPKIKHYLGFHTYQKDLNLETRDIKGGFPLDHYGKLECKIKSARPNDIRPIITSRNYHFHNTNHHLDTNEVIKVKSTTENTIQNQKDHPSRKVNKSTDKVIENKNQQNLKDEDKKVQFNQETHLIENNERYENNPQLKSAMKKITSHQNSKCRFLGSG